MGEKKKFLLRLDAALFDAIEKWAADDLRSVNAEIEYLLAEAARKAGRAKREPGPPPGGRANGDPAPPDRGPG